VNTVFPATSAVEDDAGHTMVTAYALHRPDGKWSIMLVNRDQSVAHKLRIVFHDDPQKTFGFQGDVDTYAFGAAQYQWHAATISPMSHPESEEEPVIESGQGFAKPDGPAEHDSKSVSPEEEFDVPAASILVVRGNIAPVAAQ
jgi:hypothetical protein